MFTTTIWRKLSNVAEHDDEPKNLFSYKYYLRVKLLILLFFYWSWKQISDQYDGPVSTGNGIENCFYDQESDGEIISGVKTDFGPIWR